MVSAKPGQDEEETDPEAIQDYLEARNNFTPTILGRNHQMHKNLGHPGAKLLYAFLFTGVWVIFGSFMFQYLEHEDMVKWQAGNHNFEDVLETMRNITDSQGPIVLTENQRKRMEHATNFMTRNKPAHVGMSIEGGFFFSVLSLTTIGYGRFLIPRTMWGRLFVIPYTLIGIPLLGIMYTVWAKVALGKIKMAVAWCQGSRARKWQTTMVAMFVLIITLLVITPLAFMAVEDWEYYEAVYFTWVTVSTIGYGDFVPETDRGEWLGIILVPLGLGIVSLVFGAITQWFEDTFVYFDYDETHFKKSLEASVGGAFGSPKLDGRYGATDIGGDELEDPTSKDEPKVTDPLLGNDDETAKVEKVEEGRAGAADQEETQS